MRAVIYKGIRHVAVEDVEKPEIGPRDILVKNMRAGICGTDIEAFLEGGDDVGIYPGNQIGHEFVSEVVEVGDEVDDERITSGLRVWVHPGKSKRQGEGRPLVEIADSAGGLAQYISIHDAEINFNLFPLPDTLTWDEGVVIEPFSVANHGVNMTGPKVGQRALIYGAGAIGLGVLANLRAKGIEEVIVSDIVQNRLDVARAMGGIPVNATETDPIHFASDRLGSVTDFHGNPKPNVDLFFDAAGVPSAIHDYVRGGKPDSCMVVIAVSTNTVHIPQAAFVLSGLRILGSAAYDAADINEVISYIAEGRYDPTSVVTHHFSQEEAPRAFETAADPNNDAIKVVINVHS